MQRGEPIHAMCNRGYMEITCNVEVSGTGTTFLPRIAVLFLVFSFSYCEVVECGRENGFAMSERANYGSKSCRFVEAERVWNLGEWDKKAEYANCCGYGPRL